jgi:hypothetical protein
VLVLGSAGALQSAYVADELRLFLATGRPVLIVDIDAQLGDAVWALSPWSQLVGVFRPSRVTRWNTPFRRIGPVVLRDSFVFASGHAQAVPPPCC